METRQPVTNHDRVSRLIPTISDRLLVVARADSPLIAVADALTSQSDSDRIYVVTARRQLLGSISLIAVFNLIYMGFRQPPFESYPNEGPVSFLADNGPLKYDEMTALDLLKPCPVVANVEDEIAELLGRLKRANITECPVVDADNCLLCEITMFDLISMTIGTSETGTSTDTRSLEFRVGKKRLSS